MNIFSRVYFKLCSIFGETNVERWRKAGVKVGDNCEIFSTASYGSEPYLISIGNHVRINKNVEFVTHDGGAWVFRSDYYIPQFENRENVTIFGKIVVGNNVHIGTNATIMPGVTIGNNVIIGCNAVVTKDVPDNSVYAGIPARHIETIHEYERKHMNDFEFTLSMSFEEKREYLVNKYM